MKGVLPTRDNLRIKCIEVAYIVIVEKMRLFFMCLLKILLLGIVDVDFSSTSNLLTISKYFTHFLNSIDICVVEKILIVLLNIENKRKSKIWSDKLLTFLPDIMYSSLKVVTN